MTTTLSPAPMATSNSPTCGHPYSSRQDGLRHLEAAKPSRHQFHLGRMRRLGMCGRLLRERAPIGSRHVPQVVRKNIVTLSSFAYDPGMPSVEQFLNDRLVHGRAHFSREDASAALNL